MIDVCPTILELAGLPQPTFVEGVQQKPIEGVSMAYSFDEADAPERHETQYFEMFGNRGLYHEGWTAVTRHNVPWTTDPSPAFDDDTWELYGPDDWTQRHDLAAAEPGKLAELQRLWLIEATMLVPCSAICWTPCTDVGSGSPATSSTVGAMSIT